FDPASATSPLNRWILTELTRTVRSVNAGLAGYRFNDAAASAYTFVWNQVCDWYVELLKPVFMGEDEAAKAEAQACMAHVLDEIYKLLHPFMPFMTEELWAVTAPSRDSLLCLAAWPEPDFEDSAAAAGINWLVDLVSGIRSVRAEMNVPAGAIAPLVVTGASDATRQRFARHDAAAKRLARIDAISFADVPPANAAQMVLGEATLAIPLGGLIDLAAESARLAKAVAKAEDEISRIDKKLSNPAFVAKADPEVVEADREKKAQLQAEASRLAAALARLSA
ncbi:MAG: class I tRNA ligase family protein, partial [Rhizobiaceae bacterium]